MSDLGIVSLCIIVLIAVEYFGITFQLTELGEKIEELAWKLRS